MVYVWSPILSGDNKRKYSSQQPWIHGTPLMWALHVWFCVTGFSSLTALLGYLVTYKIRAHSPSPDGRYQIICNFVRTFYEPLDYANLIFDRCVAARLCQQTRFIVPVAVRGCQQSPDCAGRLRIAQTPCYSCMNSDQVAGKTFFFSFQRIQTKFGVPIGWECRRWPVRFTSFGLGKREMFRANERMRYISNIHFYWLRPFYYPRSREKGSIHLIEVASPIEWKKINSGIRDLSH